MTGVDGPPAAPDAPPGYGEATTASAVPGRDPDDRDVLTREVIVTATRAYIEEHGLDSVSLRRLSATLGVTAPALYAYVRDKRDLLRAVAELAFADLLERFDSVPTDDPLERIRELSRVYIRFALDNPELFRTMFLFPPDLSLSPATGEEHPSATQAFQYAIGTIEAAQAAGVLRPELDPVIVSITTWTATHGLAQVLSMGFAFDDVTRDTIIDTTVDTLLRGLAPTP